MGTVDLKAPIDTPVMRPTPAPAAIERAIVPPPKPKAKSMAKTKPAAKPKTASKPKTVSKPKTAPKRKTAHKAASTPKSASTRMRRTAKAGPWSRRCPRGSRLRPRFGCAAHARGRRFGRGRGFVGGLTLGRSLGLGHSLGLRRSLGLGGGLRFRHGLSLWLRRRHDGPLDRRGRGRRPHHRGVDGRLQVDRAHAGPDALDILAHLLGLAHGHGLVELALEVGCRTPELAGIKAEAAHQLGQVLGTHHDDGHHSDHQKFRPSNVEHELGSGVPRGARVGRVKIRAPARLAGLL